MYTCITYEYRCLYNMAHMWRSEDTLRYWYSLFTFFETGSVNIAPKITRSYYQLRQRIFCYWLQATPQASRFYPISPILLLRCWNYRCTLLFTGFMEVVGIKTQAFTVTWLMNYLYRPLEFIILYYLTRPPKNTLKY